MKLNIKSKDEVVEKKPVVKPVVKSLVKKIESKKAPASAESYGVARKDEIILQDGEVAEKLIAGAPDKKDGYIKVKTIL